MDLNSVLIAQTRPENQLLFDQDSIDQSVLRTQRRRAQLHAIWLRSQIAIEALVENLQMIVKMATAQRTS